MNHVPETEKYDFNTLILPYYDELIAFTLKKTKNRQKAEDIVQTALLKALVAWDRWVPVGEPVIWARAWIYRIVTTTFIKVYNKEKTFARIVTPKVATSGPGVNIHASNQVGHVIEELYQNGAVTNHPYAAPDSIGDEVREALSRIRPEWAQIIQMVYVDNIPAHEVADKLGLAHGTVRSRMARGRLALARILSPIAKQRFGRSQSLEAVSDGETAERSETPELPESDAHGVQGVVA